AKAEAFEDAKNLAQSDVQSRMLTGVPLPAEAQARIKRGLSPKQWDAYQADAKRSDLVYKQAGDIRTTPTSELMGLVEKLKPVGGETDFNDRQAAYSYAAALAKNELALRSTDPGQAVRNSFPTTVGVAWQAFEEKPGPETLQAALKASETAQAAMGIP